ncbi:hypothetical protein IGI04_030525, partial [Brassica rapa subsp. trilocularis]
FPHFWARHVSIHIDKSSSLKPTRVTNSPIECSCKRKRFSTQLRHDIRSTLIHATVYKHLIKAGSISGLM